MTLSATLRSPARRSTDLPRGTLALATRYVEEAEALLRTLSGASLGADRAWVERQLWLPLELEPDWPKPRAPLPVGEGAVHADLVPGDDVAFTRLCESGEDWEAEGLAAEAQCWRLPVTPYRAARQRWTADATPPDLGAPQPRRPDTLRVIDLSALWAGPLATGLLQGVGVQVVKLDPSCRPDGFRQRPALYRALNAGKDRIDLDLRRAADRARFERWVAGADLVVDSFHRRVMPNLGYGPEELRRLNPEIATLSITAFPEQSAERDWVAYGAGVHAASGLGGLGGEPVPAPVAYPDALAGLRAFGVGLGLLASTGARPHAEVSLAGSLAPLLEDRGGS